MRGVRQESREARRTRRLGRERRLAELLPHMPPADGPVVLRAGWGGRAAGAAFAAGMLLRGAEPGSGESPGDWIVLVWAALVWAWLCCRMALWRIVADADGVLVRRWLRPRRLPWDRIRTVEHRRDGALEFGTADGERVIAGAFAPPALRLLLRSLRLPATGRRAADRLALMVRQPALRPPRAATGREAGLPLLVWSAVPLGLLVADWFLVG
ncbi:PH domain-containing protein [Streptomyces radiopugnans]|uniref:PH domain-containing protein n=1 Tax=Streptomyces radiopugnans TaxID=403935 RepID=A0A1H9GPZ3_9ACTN|nr:PH domain-containing protein [Streptomyces radiopugnans]SEQ52084.1 PH domain-containing protein [Streptomyces radiopugnans]